MKQRILRVASRSNTTIPLVDLVTERDDDRLSDAVKRGILQMSVRGAAVNLIIGPYIGVLELSPTITLDVVPRIPFNNINRILDVSGSSLSRLDNYYRDYEARETSGSMVRRFIVECFLAEFESVSKKRVHKKYKRRTENSGFPKGKIHFAHSLKKNWVRSPVPKVVSSHYVQTTNTPLNRILFSALKLIANSEDQENNREWMGIRSKAISLMKTFPSEVPLLRSKELARDLLTKDHPDQRFARLQKLAVLVLSGQSVGIERSSANETSFHSFLLNLESLFEEYLRGVLFKAACSRIVIKDGNTSGAVPLFDERRHPKAKPDLVIFNRNLETAFTADVKYKAAHSRADINQVVTYAVRYGVEKTLLILGSEHPMEPRLRKIGTIGGIELLTYHYYLSNPDLFAEEELFVETMESLGQSN